MTNLDVYEKYRVILKYNDLPSRTVGIYPPSNLHEMEQDAKRIFIEYLSELPKDRLVHKLII